MKHRFSSIGMPSCMKWQEIPLVHSPAFQALQGFAQELVVEETRWPFASTAAALGGVGGVLAKTPAAEFRAAATLFFSA